MTILEGESLVNDATALVSLRTAVAAFPLAAAVAAGEHAEKVTIGSVAVDFGRAVVLGVGFGVARRRRHRACPAQGHRPGHRHLALVHRALPGVPARRALPRLRGAGRRRRRADPRPQVTDRAERVLAPERADQLGDHPVPAGERRLPHDRPADAPARRRRRPTPAWAGDGSSWCASRCWSPWSCSGRSTSSRSSWLAAACSQGEGKFHPRARRGRSRGPACAAWSRSPRRSRCPRTPPSAATLVLVAMVVTVGHPAAAGPVAAVAGPLAAGARTGPARGRPPGGDHPAGLGRGRAHGARGLRRRRPRHRRDAAPARREPHQHRLGAARPGPRRRGRDAERDLPPDADRHARGRARRAAADPRRGHRRPGGARPRHGPARHRGVDARPRSRSAPTSCARTRCCRPSAPRTSASTSPTTTTGSWRRPARTAARSACATARPGCTCGCAWTAATSGAATPRPQKHAVGPLPRDRPPGDAQLRARRVLALVLRGRPARLRPSSVGSGAADG